MASKETTPKVPPIPKAPEDTLSSSPSGKNQEEGAGSWDDLMTDIQAAEDAKEDNPGFFRRAGERINGWAGKVKEKLGDTALGAALTGSEASKGGRGSSRHIELTTPDSEADRNSVEDDQDEVSTSTPESQSGDSGGDEKNDKPVDGGEQQKQEIPEAESRILEGRRKRVEAAKERLADVAKKYGEKSEAYKRAESDLRLREDFLRNLESEFGSSAEHSDEPDSDKPEQDRTTPEQGDQVASDSSTEGRQDDTTTQETSEPESDKEDKKSPEVPTPEDAARAKIAELEEILNDDNATQDEKYRAAYMRKQLLNGLMSKRSEETKPAGDASTVETDDSSESETVDDSVEAAKKDLEKERSAVAKDLTEAMQQLSEHKPGDPAYNGLLARVKGLRNRFNYISEQIKEESGADGKRDDIEDKNKGSAESQETSESEDDKKDKKSPEAPTPDNDLEKKVAAARDEYAKRRAEYEQTGMFKKLLKGKELKKRMELARAELEGYMTQLVYHQKDQERSIIKNGVEGANEEEQKEARQKAIQSIAAAVLEQHALVDEKTQEEYDKRLDERSLFKKVAAKIGQWFVGKENKDGGKLGLGGWLRSGGAGLAAGVTLGIFGVSFPISSVVGSVSSAGVKVAAHQRALENARGEKRKLSDEELARFASGAQDLEWTTEEKDGSDRKDQSKEAVASMVGAALAETQKDSEKRQKNMTAIGSKAAMGWGLGLAAGRVTTEFIKNHIIPDQKLANTDPSNGGGSGTDPSNPGSGSSEAGGQGLEDRADDLGMTDLRHDAVEAPTISPDTSWPWDHLANNPSIGSEEATSTLYRVGDWLREQGFSVDFPQVGNGEIGMTVGGNDNPEYVNGVIDWALEKMNAR